MSLSKEVNISEMSEKPFLSRLSISMFSLVMGIGGLGNAWYAASLVFSVPIVISQALLCLATGIFIVLFCLHLMKLRFHLSSVIEEFAHPVRASFFPAMSVAALVLSIGIRPYLVAVAEGLWIFGAALHLLLAVTLIRRWITTNQDETVLTPAWFIPVVGNILVPVGGVPLGYIEISWFFFSIGLVFWLIFFSIVMHRILFCAPMSDRSLPTLFILLAPPSIGLTAYLAFTGGNAGALVDIFYSLALFIAILLLTLVRHFTHGPFFMSWWAMTFPTDGWAGASILYYRARPSLSTAVIAIIALAIATLIASTIAVQTARHIVSGRAFREE